MSAIVVRARSRAVVSEQRCIVVDRRCRESEGKAKIEGYMSVSDEEAHQHLAALSHRQQGEQFPRCLQNLNMLQFASRSHHKLRRFSCFQGRSGQ